MFWTITATLTLEWLTAVACHITLHGFINCLLWLAAMSLLLALAGRVREDGSHPRRSLPSTTFQPILISAVVRNEPAKTTGWGPQR